MQVSDIKLVTADPREASLGLLGWVSCTIDGKLRLDGLAIRKTRDGRRILTFPGKTDASGQQQYFARPLNNETRLAIERRVFEALAADGAFTARGCDSRKMEKNAGAK